ncbi:MAG: hypothetical protein MUE40_20880 [Anaerolineae bacterium]|jgi:hypothetical protein|nr:hypothetical protein [Anaerolineae bacterium]
MTYQIRWHIENRVIHFHIWDKFTEAEMISSSEEIGQLLAQGTAPIHIICDVNGVTDYPRNIPVIKRSAQVYMNNPAMGWFIYLGFEHPIMRFLSSTIMQVLLKNFKHARSMEHVNEILPLVDPSLEVAISGLK